jgi:hypothetical protein
MADPRRVAAVRSPPALGTTTQPRKTKLSGTVAVIVIAVLLLMVLGLIELIGRRRRTAEGHDLTAARRRRRARALPDRQVKGSRRSPTEGRGRCLGSRLARIRFRPGAR